MKARPLYIFLAVFIFFSHLNAQETEEVDPEDQEQETLQIETDTIVKKRKKERKVKPYEPLAPARAAFYSAILPGLGQAYTGKYWKIPIVYAALGTGVFFYVQNNNNYNLFRDIYKRRLAGLPDLDPRFETFTEERLIDLQRRYRRDQELALLVTVGLYILNIVDANVSAHLQQYNITDELSFQPKVNFDDIYNKPNYGISLNLNF